MLAPLAYIEPATAATEWEYHIRVVASKARDSGSKSGAISATLKFSDGDVGGRLDDGVKSKGSTANLNLKTSYAPWTLKSLELGNSTKDGYKMYHIYVNVLKSGSSAIKTIIDNYPEGASNQNGGQWIDQNDGHPKTHTVYANSCRAVNKADNFFDQLGREIFLEPQGEKSDQYVEYKWSGKISDNYDKILGSSYQCMDLPDAPNFEISVSGLKGDNSKVTEKELKENGFQILNDVQNGFGYKFNRYLLSNYMNKNNIYCIDLNFNLQFPYNSTAMYGGIYNIGTSTCIYRNAFALESVNFSKNYHYAGNDNYFYNNSIDKKISVTANIKTTGSSRIYGYNSFKDATIYFDKAYLKAGDNIVIDAADSSGKAIKSVKVDNSKSFTLNFPYTEGLDSENAGLVLMLENARLKYNMYSDLEVELKLWDENYNRSGFSNRPTQSGYFMSTHKLDSKNPTVAIFAADGTDLNKWNKTVTLSSMPSEDIYYTTANGRQQGFLYMNLTNGTSAPAIYKYNYTEQNKGAASSLQKVPALKGFDTKITLALRDKLEGEFDLVLSGYDYAGNMLQTVYKGIKLDNKAPVVTVSEKVNPKTDGKKGNVYDVKISDASGTGRLYYMFTKKHITDIPAYDNSGSHTSGEMDTTLDKWAYIEQKDTENGKTAAAYLDVEKGDSFIGYLVYFAVDEAGNKTDVSSKSININNEDTTYDITPKNPEKPKSSYDIYITSNNNNKIEYLWKNYIKDEATGKMKENFITSYEVYNGCIDTSKDERTKNLNGTYTLEFKITPPSNTNIVYVPLNYVFDNEGPVINLTPSTESFKSAQTVSVYATDLSDVYSASARLVTPDGKNIDGMEEFSLSVSNGIVSQSINVCDVPAGAYALKVTATDANGLSATEISKPFFIKNSAPTGTVDVASSILHNGKSLISDENIKLSFDITEDFANASYAENQCVYYRISTVSGQFGEWKKAANGKVLGSMNTLSAKFVADENNIALVDGANTLFVQTAICTDGADESKIDLNTVKNDEIIFYFDNTAPEAHLSINDIHTKESIKGKLYVSDNLDSALKAVCSDANVKIGALSNGEFDITVLKNTDTVITVSDASNNSVNVKLVITGIDSEAPVSDITVAEKTSGERIDAAATVTVNDADANSVKFAFIPTDRLSGSTISDEFFTENLSEDILYRVVRSRAEEGKWEGENNIIYNVSVSGTDGSWYVGVRASDSLGNTVDKIFTDSPITAKDAELTANLSVSPVKTASRTVASVTYNVPVYTLAQDKIVDANSDIVKNNTLGIEDFNSLSTAQKIEAANLELAKLYALSYSGKYTFSADSNRVYDLYTVDDLGRTKHLTADVKDIDFNSPSGIKANVYSRTGEGIPYTYTLLKNEEVCAANTTKQQLSVIVEADGGDGNTLFLPKDDEYTDTTYTNGLYFQKYASRQFAFYSRQPDENNPYDEGEIKGYTKLVYSLNQIESDDGGYMRKVSDVTERIVSVFAFDKDATDTTDPGQVAEKSVVLSGIDNNAPVIEWSVSPEVLTYEMVDYGGEFYPELVAHPTPGNVTFTIRAQDKESGIGKIIALYIPDINGEEQEVAVPMTDENGNPTEYWSWDGSEHPFTDYEWDEATETQTPVQVIMPVKVEYFGDGDIYAEKMLTYTFTDAYSIKHAGVFVNTLGAEEQTYIHFRPDGDGGAEGGLSTVGLIYKMPIEEGIDYNIKYFFENASGDWEEITEKENTFYKNAKAVVEINDGRGVQRGLYVSNNSRSAEKLLSSYQNSFTFKLKDKYGYTHDAQAVLENFDTIPGTVDYSLSTTAKTNKDVEVKITVSDEKSGIGTVSLTDGKDSINLDMIDEYELTKEGVTSKYRVYRGNIEKNGTYSITLFDNARNKTVKSFNVKNINKDELKAEVAYSTKEYTSRPVTATLTFNRHNVRIVNVEPVATITSADYSVNYNTSVITFTKSGSLSVFFEDDYGNKGSESVAVGNIDKTPPQLECVADAVSDPSVVSVTFNKIDDLTSKMDLARKESDIFVTYGGMTKTVADEEGNKNSFVFYENGNYTFKVHDKEGLSSFLTVTIADLDKKAPKITSVKWSYEYDEFDEITNTWITKPANGERVPQEGKAGYVVGATASENENGKDAYPVTNKDVTVTVETDDDTRLAGSSDDYGKIKEKVYDQNGLFIFNTEKKNGLTASYGVDIEIIDKTAPVIDLTDLGSELVFYENSKMNSEYDISMIEYVKDGKYTAYKAYDVFNGRKADLTEKVKVTYDNNFNPNNLSLNKFDASKPYTVTYTVFDSAGNKTEAKRSIRLVGKNDTIALVNGALPDFAGRIETSGDSIKVSLANFAGTAYVRYEKGIKTMGQMKKIGTMVTKNADGDFEVSNLSEGWYTFYVQTDKRDYFTLCVYLCN